MRSPSRPSGLNTRIAIRIPKTIDRVIVGSWFWTINPKLSLEARFNHNEDNNSVSPNTFFPFKTTPFNVAAPYLSGSFITGHSTTNGKDYIFAPANAQLREKADAVLASVGLAGREDHPSFAFTNALALAKSIWPA